MTREEELRRAREWAWREGYHTGKRDYATSITSGRPISTPNPHQLDVTPLRRGDDQ